MKRFLGVMLLFVLLAGCGDFEWFPGPNPNVDTTPDQFTFNNRCAVALNADVQSNTITITGINAPTSITITGGEYSLDNGTTYTTAQGTVNNNATVVVRPTGAGTSGGKLTTLGTYHVTLTVGGVSATYTVTTDACVATTP